MSPGTDGLDETLPIREARLRELELTNEALRDLITTTIHDVQNPLTVIIGFSSILRAGHDFSQAQRTEFAEFIYEAATRANDLVRDLLQLAKLEAGVSEARPAVIDLSSAVESVRRQPEGSMDEIVDDVPDDLMVSVDPDHLHRILSNLIMNASKYGAPPVSVSAEAIGGRVLIHVADHGVGVPPDFVPHLFEKFARADAAKRSNPDGTGLGLTIVAGLARSNGGSVSYEPNDPRGARFIVELKAAADLSS